MAKKLDKCPACEAIDNEDLYEHLPPSRRPTHYHTCCVKCHAQTSGQARYSLGIYAGRYCDGCWDKSGYRKEGKEGYDFLDAGEYYEADEY